MRYLFFDLECSNCFNRSGKICEYGFVLTDENFEVIEQDFFPMAPGDINDKSVKFDKRVYRSGKAFDWYLKPEQYFAYPEFPYFYEHIAKLMEDKETLIFGFSVNNDVEHLESTINRYQLKSLNYKAIDVQYFASKYLKVRGNQIGLQNAFIALCKKEDLENIRPHLSKDDAFMTMKVLKSVLDNTKLSLNELLIKYPKAIIDSKKHSNEIRKRKIVKEFSAHVIESDPKYKNCMIKWHKFLAIQEKRKAKAKNITNKETCFLSFDAKRFVKPLNAILEALNALDIEITNDYENATYVIALNAHDKKRIISLIKNDYKAIPITTNELRLKANLEPVENIDFINKKKRKRKNKNRKKNKDVKSYKSIKTSIAGSK